MALGKQKADWDRTAALICSIQNMVRAEGDPPIHPREVNPYRVYRRAEYPITIMKVLLPDGH